MTRSDHEEAERLGRKRAQIWPLFAIIFVSQQASFFSLDHEGSAMRPVEWVKTGGWLALSMVMLAAVMTGGYWFKRREVRELMEDEVTRKHRADALALGFLLAMVMTLAMYVTSLFEEVPVRLALHAILSAGLVTALIRFGLLERRAYRG